MGMAGKAKYSLGDTSARILQKPVIETLKRIELVKEILIQNSNKSQGDVSEFSTEIVGNLAYRKIRSDVIYIHKIFEKLLQELSTTKSFESLNETVIQGQIEQDAKKEYIALYQGRKWKQKQFERSDRVGELTRHLQEVENEIKELSAAKDLEILKFENEIVEAKSSNPQWVSYETKLAEVQSENLKFHLEKEEEELQEQLVKLNRELPEENKAHDTLIYYLDKSCENLSLKLREWNINYEEETHKMAAKITKWRTDLEAMDGEFEAVKKECREYRSVVKDYEEEQARRHMEKEEHERRWKAAVSIQARWRGWKVRRALAASSKRKMKKKNKK